MIKIFGIKNCDTMKKAFKWLDEKQVEYVFHDYKKEGLSEELATQWIEKLGWETVINKKGTTWRKLDEPVKNNMNNAQAIETVCAQPSMIKRPLIEAGDKIILGFKADEYEQHFL